MLKSDCLEIFKLAILEALSCIPLVPQGVEAMMVHHRFLLWVRAFRSTISEAFHCAKDGSKLTCSDYHELYYRGARFNHVGSAGCYIDGPPSLWVPEFRSQLQNPFTVLRMGPAHMYIDCHVNCHQGVEFDDVWFRRVLNSITLIPQGVETIVHHRFLLWVPGVRLGHKFGSQSIMVLAHMY